MKATVIYVLNWISSFIFAINIKNFVRLSLAIQFFLLMAAPLRKRYLGLWANVVSFVYLFDNWLAMSVVASIPKGPRRSGDIMLFWVPFIILQLGSPNTLTSLTLDDNELWLRQCTNFISLFWPLGLAIYRYSFIASALWWPTLFAILAAVITYFEKTLCLFLASLNQFRESNLPTPDPGVNYAELMDVYKSFSESDIPVEFDVSCTLEVTDHDELDSPTQENTLSHVQIVAKGYELFQEFQGLFVNSVYSYDQRHKTRQFFLTRSSNAEEAFSICEAELNFAYDVFYTKAILTHKFKYSPLLNLLSLMFQLASLYMWINMKKEDLLKSEDILNTHFLVGGCVAFTILSLLMFLTSDWCITMVFNKQKYCWVSKILCFYEWLLSTRRTDRACKRSVGFRWSKNIPQLNLLKKIVSNLHFKDDLRDFIFTELIINIPQLIQGSIISNLHFKDDLRDFIFTELIIRSSSAEYPKEVEEMHFARGCWILHQMSWSHKGLENVVNSLDPWISDVEYEESLILWHLATTLCYYENEENASNEESHLRKLSEILSNYMLSVLIDTRGMVSESTHIAAQRAFRDTKAEGTRFCKRLVKPNQTKFIMEEQIGNACMEMMKVNTDIISPRQIRGDDSKALLFDACALAKQLQGLKDNKWNVISKVLAEMLFYTAAHSSGKVHLRLLRTGGELLTHVWLMMAHLGLGNHFRHKKRVDKTAQLVLRKHN